MKGYAATEFFGEWLDTRDLASSFIREVHDPGCEIRCHELARAVQLALYSVRISDTPNTGFFVEDGKFGPIDHSWIRLDHKTILDVYTPGTFPMVHLVHYSPLLPYFEMYKKGSIRRDINEAKVGELFNEMTKGFILSE